METTERLGPGVARSTGARRERRIPQAWPKDRKFRILCLDGGGIRGIFPAAILAGLEERVLGGKSIAGYFDLIAGTSTGGILALGLASGLTGRDLLNLYVERGHEVFPPGPRGVVGRFWRWWRDTALYASTRYDREGLDRLLRSVLDDRLLGDAANRLCVPAFDGRHSEVYVFKTPHHPDYRTDRHERMVKIGLATAAAPAFFRPLPDNGYVFVDGGVWANNPIMLAVVEALTCFDVGRDQIEVLSLGCGDDPYVVSPRQLRGGGLLAWKDIIYAAMRLQSLAATNQARLLLGPQAVIRIDAPTNEKKMALDDWRRAVTELPPAAARALDDHAMAIAEKFLGAPAVPYVRCPDPDRADTPTGATP